MDGRNLAIRMGLVAMLALVGVALALLVFTAPAHAVITGDAPPASGDWIITHKTKVINEPDIQVNGNIVIENELDIWNSSVYMNLWMDDLYIVNVSYVTNAYLYMNQSYLTSSDTNNEYGFLCWGKMKLTYCDIEEVYNGIQVLTDKTVLIQNCVIQQAYGMGLYLENANGTTVKQVTIQSDEVSVNAYIELESHTSNDYPSATISGSGGALYVKGGKPTISGVNVSVNGTIFATVKCTDDYYYAYYYVTCNFPIVSIDSKYMTEVSGINVRDSKLNFKVHYNLYWSMYEGEFLLYTYTSASAINVLNYGDVTLKNCNAINVNVGTTSVDYTNYGSGSYFYAYTYTYGQGMKLFTATLSEKFHDAGPHTSKLTIKDATFEEVGVLGVIISPDYDGTVQPTFESTVIIDNVKVNKGSNIFSFNTAPRFSLAKIFKNDFRITNSTFTNLSGQLLSWAWSAGPGVDANKNTFDIHEQILVENCLFRWCKASSGLFYESSSSSYKYEYNNVYDVHLNVRKCKFLDNQAEIANMYGNYYTTRGSEQFSFDDNLVQNNSGSNYFFYTYYIDTISVSGNTFLDNSYQYGIDIMDYGGDSNGKKPCKFNLNNNYLRRNKISSNDDYQKGFFRPMWGGDLNVSGNNVSDVDTCFLNIYPYVYYSGYARVDFKQNYFENNNGSFVYFYDTYSEQASLKCYIDGNTARNNNGPFMGYRVDSNLATGDYDADVYFRNNTVVNTTGTVVKTWGNLFITGNTFKDCLGYVIDLQYLNLHPPTIRNNVITNCKNVYYLAAKDKGVLKMTLTVKDLFVDCTGNAFYFKNIDATLQNITVTNRAEIAIIAENANVDAEGSTIPIGSGEVIGDGTINVWFDLEVFVYWSNVTAPTVSSGQTVSEALVVLYGHTGAYYTSEYTDTSGHLQQVRIPQWGIKGAFTTIWTPYCITVAKSGVTAKGEFDLDHDFVGPKALSFLLVDTYIPVIRITSPFPGDVFAAENMTVRGFTTEVGSGIKMVQVYFTDQQGRNLPPVTVPVTVDGDFVYNFTEMPEGDNIVMHAVVWDMAKNFNQTAVTIVIDRTPPVIDVIEPKDGSVINTALIKVLGTYEPGAKIRINGLERPGPYTGILNEEFTLSEGNNTIVVEAIDMAGNIGSVVMNVRLDRFAPTLTVLEPRDGLITKVTNITIEGEVETGARITVSVYRTTHDLINETVTPRPDGTFTHKVDLAEGINSIVVRAWDDAKNLAEVTRVVTVDTTAPTCEITSPKDGAVTNQNTIRVLGRADPASTLYLNGKQIFNDGTVDRVVALNEGRNTIELRTVDRIGNEFRARVTVTLDTKAPIIVMTKPLAESLKTNTAVLEVAGTVTGGVNSLLVMGQSVAVTGDPATFSTIVNLPQEGLNDVIIEAIDLAGNRATHTISVDYSTVKPVLNILFQPSITNVKSEDRNFYITGTTTPGIKEVTISHTTAKKGTETNTYTVDEFGAFTVVRILADGQNEFTIRVTDAHGNVNETTPYVVQYTYQAPATTPTVSTGVNPGAISGIILAISVALLVTAVVVTRSYRARK